MAERRMFSMKIIDTDAFLEMPLSTQALYFHLSMRADDEGFVSSPKKIKAMIGASDDDLRLLIAKRYILTFDSGIIVIKHWKIHNYIQNDRFQPTTYVEEKQQLSVDDKKAYVETNVYTMDTKCIQTVSTGKDSIDKDSIYKEKNIEKKSSRSIPPTLEEVEAYCKERKNGINAQRFLDYYESRGWEMKKGIKVKDWKACVRTWESMDKKSGDTKNEKEIGFDLDDFFGAATQRRG